jgi:hypothetical protein
VKKQKKRREPETSTLAKKPQRKLGIYRSRIKIADEFDAPLPDEILDAFEGRAEKREKKQTSK